MGIWIGNLGGLIGLVFDIRFIGLQYVEKCDVVYREMKLCGNKGWYVDLQDVQFGFVLGNYFYCFFSQIIKLIVFLILGMSIKWLFG